MSLKTLLYFLSVVFLRPDSLCAQQLHIDYTRNPVEVTEAHLEIPFTAGSDYASNIPLSTAAIVRVIGLSEFDPWCLQAYLLGQSSNTPSITLSADLESVDLSQADLDGTPLSLQLESFARPVFSGIGNVNQLFVQLSIQGAQVSHHTMEIGFWRLLGSIKKPGARPGFKKYSALVLHQLYVYTNQVFKLL